MGTDRQAVLEFLALLGCAELIGFDNFQEALKISEDLAFLEACRYFQERKTIPKSVHWLESILPNLDDKRFRGQLRMNQQAFIDLLDVIDGPWITTHQEPLPLQVAVALNVLGSYGNSASTETIAGKFGISHGSVDNFTNRVCARLCDLSSSWIRWPSKEERRSIGQQMLNNLLPKCVGFVDGSHVPFFKAPSNEKEAYWSRKKQYAMQFQLICDPQKRIRHLFSGYPASVHDAKVFAATRISQQPQHFFSTGEYLVGDSAYPKSETLIVPYKKRGGGLSVAEKKFNRHISSNRVAVEHTIGLLKGRFQSLREMRIQINRRGHKLCCERIQAACVLHNFLILRDPWTQEGDEIEPGDHDEDNEEVGEPVPENRAAELKRRAVLEIICALKH